MRALATLVSLFLLGVQAQHDWSYSEGGLEEEQWPEAYPDCGGQKQSPIDLQRRQVRFNQALGALNLTGYDGEQSAEYFMINNGHTVQITLSSTMTLTAPDGTVYHAVQMHYHWGGASSEVSGSEHTIDGIRKVIEIHVVHYNSKYGSYDVAKTASDGLAVLAAFIEIEEYAENTYYSDFIAHLANIKYTGQNTTLKGLNVRYMLPGNLQHYYTYHGSLTTPPCTENVRWFVLADSVKISRSQVWKVENTVLNHHNETLHSVYRRTQPLNGRVVEANFRYFPNHGSESRFYLEKIQRDLDRLVQLSRQRRH